MISPSWGATCLLSEDSQLLIQGIGFTFASANSGGRPNVLILALVIYSTYWHRIFSLSPNIEPSLNKYLAHSFSCSAASLKISKLSTKQSSAISLNSGSSLPDAKIFKIFCVPLMCNASSRLINPIILALPSIRLVSANAKEQANET